MTIKTSGNIKVLYHSQAHIEFVKLIFKLAYVQLYIDDLIMEKMKDAIIFMHIFPSVKSINHMVVGNSVVVTINGT